ncbi:MAG TPA: response regulator, partial [Thermoanaerobaculia bacterium]|nr:response regulator [Thermoanaerobaculia bacterium]
EVESEEGRGTTFFFTLRCRTSPAAGASPLAAAAPVPTDPRSLAGAKILVADDNEVNVMVLSAFLRKWGVEVDVAANGRQAVDRTAERAYDLVLMDLRMPEMDGYAATRTIRARADARLPALPILAISTAVRSDQKRDLDAVGFTDFLSKPVDPDALFAMLVRYIRGPGA